MTLLISAKSSVTELGHLAVFYNRNSVGISAMHHPVHLLPLSADWVELQDVIIGRTVITALMFVSKLF